MKVEELRGSLLYNAALVLRSKRSKTSLKTFRKLPHCAGDMVGKREAVGLSVGLRTELNVLERILGALM